MRTMIQKGLFAVMMAAGLSFGVAQAMAAPAPAPEQALACANSTCSMDCIRRGYELGGRCLDGECVCYEDAR